MVKPIACKIGVWELMLTNPLSCHYAALNEALTAEVQRLKLAATGLADAHPSKSLNQQASMDPQRYQLQSKLQRAHVPPYQLQKQQDDTVMDSRSEQ